MMAGVLDPSQANAPVGHNDEVPYSDFNFYVDPDASKGVVELCQQNGIQISLVPLDTSHQMTVGQNEIAQMVALNNPVGTAAAAVLASVAEWDVQRYPPDENYRFPRFPAHDFTLTAYLLHPELFETEAVQLRVTGADDAQPAKTILEDMVPGKGVVHVIKPPRDMAAYFAALMADLGAYRDTPAIGYIYYVPEKPMEEGGLYEDSLLAALDIHRGSDGHLIAKTEPENGRLLDYTVGKNEELVFLAGMQGNKKPRQQE
jgi:hypothetical protein